MPTRSEVIEAAYDFLRAVAEAVEANLGKFPKRLQRSTWMVHTSPGIWSGREFTREIFDRFAVSKVYQRRFERSNIQQLRQLEETLVKARIPREETRNGYLLPLVHHWLDLPDPLDFEYAGFNQELDKFADAVINGVILIKSRNVILRLDLASEPLILQQGISIRPISNEELWNLGDIENVGSFIPIPSVQAIMPSEDWKILDIEMRHEREGVHPPRAIGAIQAAVLVVLGLVSSRHLQVFDLGMTDSYGMGAAGVRTSEPIVQHINRWGGQYILDVELSKRLKALWPRMSRILTSERHHLRIPALRLLDGGGRLQKDDAIVDYAIGLEALLLKGINAELSYRFALRGATILAWEGGEKEKFFTELRDFYDIRSKIVHGSHIDPTRLRYARSNGEQALRDIWWWYFYSGGSLSHALKRVDRRILQ